MANEQNLKVPSSKEARENGKKGGVASGKARRKKANLKKAFETILQAEVASPNVKKQLEELGFDSTNEMALAMVMMQKAMKGNVRAFEQISKLTTTDAKDNLDKKEQKERIKALQLKNKREENLLENDITHKHTIEIKVGDGFFQTLCQSGNGNLCLSDHKYLSLEKLRKHNSYVPGGLTEKKIKNSTVAWAWQFAKEVEDD